MIRTTVASILLTLTLLILPGFFWLEQHHATTWSRRLIYPQLEEEPNRHTPRFFNGRYLPVYLEGNLTLGPQDNPVLIAGTSTIAPGARVTVTPGTHFYFHEFGLLRVAGDLQLQGSARAPITLESNEQHPDNRVWGGILIEATGVVTAHDTTIADASPGFSCLPGSTLSAVNTTIWRGTLGLYAASSQCALMRSTIQGAREGVVVIKQPPLVTDTVITTRGESVRVIQE